MVPFKYVQFIVCPFYLNKAFLDNATIWHWNEKLSVQRKQETEAWDINFILVVDIH